MARTAEEEKELESIKLQFYGSPPAPGAAPPIPVGAAPRAQEAVPPAPTPAPARAPVGPEGYEKASINPEYEKAPDWYDMPELAFMQAPGRNLLARFSTAFSNDPNKVAEILKAQFPGMKVEADKDFPKYMKFTSPTDGKTYFWKPGVHANDLARGAFAAGVGGLATAGMAAAAPAVAAAVESIPTVGPAAASLVNSLSALNTAAGAGVAPAVVGAGMVAGGGAAAVDQAAQMLGGASYDPAAIPLGVATGGMTAAGGQAVRAGVHGVLGTSAPAKAATAAAATPTDPYAHAVDMVRKPEAGHLADDFVGRMGTNPRVAAAEKELGISLDPELRASMSNPDSFNAVKLAQGIRSSDASLSKGVQDTTIGKAAEQAVTTAKNIGARTDRGAYAQEFASVLTKKHDELVKAAEDAWNNKIQGTARAEYPTELVEWASKFTKNIDKFPRVKALLQDLIPSQERRPDGKMGARYQPDWSVLDSRYKSAQAAARGQGAFSDWSSAEQGFAKNIVDQLRPVRERTFAKHAGPDALREANAATAVLKRFEEGIDSAIGKRKGPTIEGNPFDYVEPALKDLADGNPATLSKMVKGLEGLRAIEKEDLVFSGLMSLFEKSETNQPLNWTGAAKFFRQVRSQPESERALMSMLSPNQRKKVIAIADVADNIDKVVALRTRTGNAAETRRAIRAVDSSMNLVMDTVSGQLPRIGAGLGALAGAATGFSGGGAGTAFMMATGGQVVGGSAGRLAQRMLNSARATPADHLLDQFLASPAYSAGIKASAGLVPVTPGLVKRFVEHPAVSKFLEANRVPPEEWERWAETFMRPAVNEAASAGTPPDEETK